MHPSKFFEEVKFQTMNEWDFGFCSDGDIRATLSEIHPMNIIKSTIKLPVFQVDISYETKQGNHKTTKKYIIIDHNSDNSSDSLDYEVEIMAENDIETYNSQHPNNPMLKWKIQGVKPLAQAVLQIG